MIRVPPVARVVGPVLAVALLALIVRGLYLHDLSASVLFQPVAGGHDRTLYAEAAQGPLWPAGAFEYLPLYPWALGVVFALTGPSLLAAAWFGIVCDALTAALIVFLSRRLGARTPFAVGAGLLYAVYPLAMAYAPLTMPATLNSLLATGVACGLVVARRDRWLDWAGVGLLAGIAALGWAAWVLIAAGLGIAWLVRRGAAGPSPAGAAAFLVAFSLPLAPVAWHNSKAEGRFVLLTTHGGFNFYMGNHERATGYTVRVRDFRMTARELLEDAHRAAEKAEGRSLARSESSAWWAAEARRFWVEHPADAIRLTLRKVVLFWNRAEVDDLRMVEQSRLLTGWFMSGSWPGFLLFGWLGLAGLLLVRRGLSLRLVVLLGTAALVLYFITARYRLALVPLLAVLGAVGVSDLPTLWTDPRRRWRTVLVLAGSLVLVAWPLAARDLRPVDHYNAAVQLLQAGRVDEALRMANAGVVIDGRSAALHHAAGSAYYRRGEFDRAAASFARCVELDAAFPRASFNLALSLARTGDTCGARDALRRIASGPGLTPDARGLLAELEKLCPDGAATP